MRKTLSFFITLMISVNSVIAVDRSGEINAATDKIMPQIIEWRRHLHRFPELSNRETKTAKYVEEHLRKLGLEVRTGLRKKASSEF